MKKLLALAVFMASMGAMGAYLVLRILSRPRVAPAPFGPAVPLPADLPATDTPEDPRFAEPGPRSTFDASDLSTLATRRDIDPGLVTESGVLLPEEVLTEERDEGMPAPLAAVAEPMGTLESDFPAARNGALAHAPIEAPTPDSSDEVPSHHLPPPISDVLGEPDAFAADIADVEPSHVAPPPVSEVTGEHTEAVIEAEESLATPVTEAIARLAAAHEEDAGQSSGVLSSYFAQLAATPVDEPPAPVVEPVPEAVEESLATISGRDIGAPGQREAESYLDEGNVYFNVGQYGLAIERYGKAIDLAPGLIAAYYNRANARTRAGEYDGALSDYDEALRLQPHDADALNNRGMLHLYRANYPEALHDFNAALAIDPTDTTVMVNRGLAHLHGDDPAAALVDFQEAASLDNSDAAAHYGAGQAAASLGNRDEALRHLGRALELDSAYAREAAADPKLQPLQGDEQFMRLLRESGSRSER